MAKIVSIDGLAAAVEEILEEYRTEVERGTKECVQKAAKAGVAALKGTSPSHTGAYAGGWTSKVEEGRLGATATIYNGKKPGLPHLLEHGHVTRNGTDRTFGSTPAQVHIAPVEEELISGFESDIVEVITS